MVLTFTNGTITTDGTEQNLFDVTGDKYYATYIFTHNMQSGDTMDVKVYVRDANAEAYRLYQTETVSFADVQTNPAVFLHFMPTPMYKVSITRTAGTDRAFTWLRMEA